MGWAMLPPCLLFGLGQQSHWIYRCFGRANGDLPKWDLCQYTMPLRTVAASAPSPWQATARDPQIWRRASNIHGRSDSVSCAVTTPFPQVLWHKTLCPPWFSVSPVLWELYNQTPLSFKVRIPGNSQSLCRNLRLGGLMWGLESSKHC